jgi:acetolactate synthase I/II/III large subunit
MGHAARSLATVDDVVSLALLRKDESSEDIIGSNAKILEKDDKLIGQLQQQQQQQQQHITLQPQSGVVKKPVKTSVRTADVLVDILVEAGVEVVFGLPGGPIAPVHDALIDRPEIKSITTRHEAGAIFAAAGYAQATGKLGVVVVTSGPGILNAMTGLASAYCDGLPVLVIAGEVPRERFGQGAVQEGTSQGLDIIHMVRPISKFAAEARDASSAPVLLRRAIATAMSGRRGPAVVTLPMDVGTTQVRSTTPVEVISRLEFDIPPATLRATSNALANAKRPLILVGSGARFGKGPELVRMLAERLQCPVMTTPKAKGVFSETHPLSLGVFGWGGHPSASEYLTAGVDVLFVIGSGLGETATDSWSTKLSASEHFIQLDIEAQRIGRNYAVTLAMVDTVESAIPKLLRALEHEPSMVGRPRACRTFGVRRQQTGAEVPVGPENKISPQRALWELQRALPATTLYTTDIGSHMFFALHHLEVQSPRGFMIMFGLGSMASGIGSSLGVKVGNPDVPVVSVCGDGCFQMGLGDVATAAQEGISMIFAVLNDERYGLVEIGNNAVYGRTPSFATPMDVCALAEGVGAAAVVIEKPGDILNLDLLKLANNRPLVLDIRIDREVRLQSGRLEFLKEMANKAKLEKQSS